MREDQNQFMRLLGQLPARLTAEQAAWVLNCQPSDVPILVAVRLLKPLGIRVTRPASGLPVGGDLEYADEVTLGRAFEGRRLLDV